MKTALVALNVSYIHKNLALRWLMVTKPETHEAKIFEGLCKAPLNLLEELIQYQAETIAFSVYIFNIDATLVLIKTLKERCPNLRIVAGGPEATYHSEPLWEAGIDGIFKGETELVFWDQLEGKQVLGYQASPNEEAEILKVDLKKLEAYPSPYFLDEDKEMMDKRYLYVESSRGCPFGCSYCMASLDRRVRLFSQSYMDDFFDQLKNSGVKQVKFLDRTFNVSKDRALHLARTCLSMPESMAFHVELVGDSLDEDLIDFFINEGQQRFRMEIGVQSLNPQALQAVSRSSHLPRLLELIKRFSSAHLKQHIDLIAGLPYEDLKSFKHSYEGLLRLQAHELQVGILKLLHGTQLKEKALEYGYEASLRSPYQITKSHWMTLEDIQAVEEVALATERAYNSQKLKDELDDLFMDLSLEPFDLMRSIGQKISELAHPYSNQAFYVAIIEGLKMHLPETKAKVLVSHAYYKNSQLWPPSLYPYTVDKGRLNKIREILDLDQNVKHAILIDRVDGLEGHELWTFGSQGQKKQCFILDKNDLLESELSL
jgi:anaerobic magnesium-protoporphyrin IX monomethyl ester cyclase